MTADGQERILVVRVGRAGDMVMITPALRAILAAHPHAELHLLTSTDGRRVLRGFDPRITQVLLYERKGLSGPLVRRRLRRAIAAGGYRHIYCFETKASYHRLLAAATSGTLHALGESDEAGKNFAERCLWLVLGRTPQAPLWVWLPVTEAGRAAARAMLAAAGIHDRTFVVGLHPSFSGLRKSYLRSLGHRRQKAWPLASYGALARMLAEYARERGLELRVIADLLPEERPLGEALAAAAAGRVTLFTGPPDFERYKATIARMNLLVTPNTGPMHIAAAVGTPMVALFAELDPRDCGPYTDPARYAVLRAEDMSPPQRGLAAIPSEAVFAACRRFLPV